MVWSPVVHVTQTVSSKPSAIFLGVSTLKGVMVEVESLEFNRSVEHPACFTEQLFIGQTLVSALVKKVYHPFPFTVTKSADS